MILRFLTFLFVFLLSFNVVLADYPTDENSSYLVQVGDISLLGNQADFGVNYRSLAQSDGFQVKENITFDTVSLAISTTATCATGSVKMLLYDSGCSLVAESASSTIPCGNGSLAYFRRVFFRFDTPQTITDSASSTFRVISSTATTYIADWNNTPVPNNYNLSNPGACTAYTTTSYRMPAKFWLYTPPDECVATFCGSAEGIDDDTMVSFFDNIWQPIFVLFIIILGWSFIRGFYITFKRSL